MEQQLIIINVLDKKYYDDCHIPGSINIPHDEFQAHIASLDKNNLYGLYCALPSCPLSKQCTQLLQDAGFEYVCAYEGGIVEWFQKGYPIEGPAQMDYLTENHVLYPDEPANVPTITAEQLYEHMKQFKLLK